MDEYSPKRHDIAQLKFLCENLYDEGIATLGDSHHGWVNDPTSSVNLQLNELIEHIASFVMSYKIKYMDESDLSELVEEYLDDTYTLFSSYGINDSDPAPLAKNQGEIIQNVLRRGHLYDNENLGDNYSRAILRLLN